MHATPFSSLERGRGALKPARDAQGYGKGGGTGDTRGSPEEQLPYGSAAAGHSSLSGARPIASPGAGTTGAARRPAAHSLLARTPAASPGAQPGPRAPGRRRKKGERGSAQSGGRPRLGSVPLAALTLAPERRHQRQEQKQPQRPGPAEVVHRPPAAARQREHSHRAWLGCPAASGGLLPFCLLLLLFLMLSQPPETGWKRVCRNPPLGGLYKDLIHCLPG